MLDLLVIGGGTAGLIASGMAAGLGARVALVERAATGGDCLWTGCVPSKALIEAANLRHAMRHADRLGLMSVTPDVDLSRVMARIRRAQATIEPEDSPQRMRAMGVDVIHDDARFVAPRTVALASTGRTIRARSVVIATGSQPVIPPIDGLADAGPLTTETVWELEALPKRLVVLGGGPIGCELGQAFARLGSSVTLVEAAPRLLPTEDERVGDLVAQVLTADGVEVMTGTRVRAVADDGDVWRLVPDGHAGPAVAFDRILVATGRRPRTADFGLDVAGVQIRSDGAVRTDERLGTTAPGVFAAGDVTGALPFTHVAAYQAGRATLNALLLTRASVSYHDMPYVVFTDPEVARVGMAEADARRRWGDDAVVVSHDYGHVDRAVTAARTAGFSTLVGDHRGRLVGATVVGPAAGEVIAEFAGAIKRGDDITKIYRTVHAYPTYALGAATPAQTYLQQRWLTARTRRITRPMFAVLRAADTIVGATRTWTSRVGDLR